jgi:hypothetical protein
MTISIPQHNRLIMTHGEKIIHYKGRICPCSDSGLPEEANPECLKCSGLGVFWNDPVTITAVITGLDSDRMGRMWLQNGVALPEDMSCSPLPGYARGFRDYDKVIPTWKRGFPYPGELLRRGLKDTLLYKPVGKIVRVYAVDPNTGIETLWKQDVDFTVGGPNGKQMIWTPLHGPQYDTVYSVVYDPRFEFVCWAPPAPRWELGRDLGFRVLLRKVHLPWPSGNWT